MSNQISLVPFGTDATVVAGYAVSTERLGNVDLSFNNVGENTLYVKVAQFVSGSPNSSYSTIVPLFSVVPKGTVTKSLVVFSKQLAFFGSGNTVANITPTFRNPSDLRGAQIDIAVQGKFGWGYDVAYDTAANEPIWPPLPSDGP